MTDIDNKTAINYTFLIMYSMMTLFSQDKKVTHTFEEIKELILKAEGINIDVETIKNITNSIDYKGCLVIQYETYLIITGYGLRVFDSFLI